MNDPVLQIENISHTYDVQPVFTDLNLAVQTGEIVSIVGASGVGKTTLFNIVAGLIKPTSGRVFIAGQNRSGQAGHVGYMLQKDLLLPFKTVYDNISLPLTLQKKSKAQIAQAIEPKLDDFGLRGLQHQYPHQISGGQRQRAALLRTYLSDSPIMLLDEPFSALDYVTKNDMYDWFKRLQRRLNLTCLIITHDIDEAIQLADRLLVLQGFPATFTEQITIAKTKNFLQSTDYLALKQRIITAMSAP